MTHLDNGTVATELDSDSENAALTAQGYTVRAVETWHDHASSCIIWDAPDLAEADMPY